MTGKTRPLRYEERALHRTLAKLADTEGSLLSRGYHYRNPADFVLREGRWFQPEPTNLPNGAPSACFGNAIVNSVRHGFLYVEGYAINGLAASVPILHAWNEDPQRPGVAIDTTWGCWVGSLQFDLPPGTAYLGVEFSYLRADEATWFGDGTVLDDLQRDYQLLREPWKGEDHARQWGAPSPVLEELYRAVGRRA